MIDIIMSNWKAIFVGCLALCVLFLIIGVTVDVDEEKNVGTVEETVLQEAESVKHVGFEDGENSSYVVRASIGTPVTQNAGVEEADQIVLSVMRTIQNENLERPPDYSHYEFEILGDAVGGGETRVIHVFIDGENAKSINWNNITHEEIEDVVMTYKRYDN